MAKYALLLGLLLVVALSVCSCGQKAQAPPSGEVADAASRFVEMMAGGDFAAAAEGFDAKMKAALTPEGLRDVWASLTGKFGAFQEQAGVRTAQEQGYEAAYVTCRFERGSAVVKVVYNLTGQISGLWIQPAE